jgi:hypothetical protein
VRCEGDASSVCGWRRWAGVEQAVRRPYLVRPCCWEAGASAAQSGKAASAAPPRHVYHAANAPHSKSRQSTARVVIALHLLLVPCHDLALLTLASPACGGTEPTCMLLLPLPTTLPFPR